MTELDTATEGSAYPLSITIKDETGAAITPTTCTWSLYDQDGDVVNSRSAVSLTPSTAMAIVLLAADLVCVDSDYNARYLVIAGTYTSSYGAGLPIKEEYLIPIEPTH